MRSFLALLSVGLVLTLIYLATRWENYGPVFALPALVLVFAQVTAFRAGKNVKLVFGLGDLAYYIGIAGVIGAGGQLFSNYKEVENFDKFISYSHAVANVDAAKAARRSASNEVQSARDSVARNLQRFGELNAGETGRCRELQFQQEMERYNNLDADLAPQLGTIYPPGCDIVLSTFDGLVTLPRAVEDARNRETSRNTVVQSYESIIETGVEDLKLTDADIERSKNLLLFWFPMFALCGVAMKIGKTANSILEERKKTIGDNA